MTAPRTRRRLSALLLFATALSAEGKSVDLLPDCAERANRGECTKNPKEMLRQCQASCDMQPGVRKVQVEAVEEGDPSFFDLSAEDAKGHMVNFRQFEGYITIVVTVPRICGYTENYYKSLDHLHDIWPWSVEVIAFPYKMAADPNDPDDCPAHREADISEKRKIHVMKPVDVNGPNTHPAVRYFKDVFDVEEDGLYDSDGTFWLVNPDGSNVEMHHRSMPYHIRDYIRKHLAHDL